MIVITVGKLESYSSPHQLSAAWLVQNSTNVSRTFWKMIYLFCYKKLKIKLLVVECYYFWLLLHKHTVYGNVRCRMLNWLFLCTHAMKAYQSRFKPKGLEVVIQIFSKQAKLLWVMKLPSRLLLQNQQWIKSDHSQQ